jgi:hypothetical protein
MICPEPWRGKQPVIRIKIYRNWIARLLSPDGSAYGGQAKDEYILAMTKEEISKGQTCQRLRKFNLPGLASKLSALFL